MKRLVLPRILAIGIFPLLALVTLLYGIQSSYAIVEARQGSGPYCVSTTGNPIDGANCSTTVSALHLINWNNIGSSNTVLLGGGIYSTTMLINGVTGTETNPITIRLADPNSPVIIDGDSSRDDLLPECIDSTYSTTDTYTNRLDLGIEIDNSSWIEIDGTVWSGIVVRDFQDGIEIGPDTSHITIKNVEVTNTGILTVSVDNTYKNNDNGWEYFGPSPGKGFGFKIGGSHHTLERVNVHDNGSDSIQSHHSPTNNLSNLTIKNSWLYNERRHLGGGVATPYGNLTASRLNDLSFNFCTHTDGVQIFSGGIVTGLTILDSIIGPGLTNGLILGQSDAFVNANVDVNTVLVKNVLITKPADSAINTPSNTNPSDWIFENITVHCMTKFNGKSCVKVAGAPTTTITNSIVYGSSNHFDYTVTPVEDERALISNRAEQTSIGGGNNCIQNTHGDAIGTTGPANLVFENVNLTDFFSQDDYSLAPSSECIGVGSDLTSVSQLLASVALPTPTPTPTPTGSSFIYDDNVFESGWTNPTQNQNGIWAIVVATTTTPTHGDSDSSISIEYPSSSNFPTFVLRNSQTFTTTKDTYAGFEFWLHGGSSGGQKIEVTAVSGSSSKIITAEAGEWTYHEFSFDDFSLSNPLPGYTDLWLRFDDSGTSEPYFIDKVRLVREQDFIFDDIFGSGWTTPTQNGNWAIVAMTTTATYGGSDNSISVTYPVTGFKTFVLRNSQTFTTTKDTYAGFEFWLHGGSSGGQKIEVTAVSGSSSKIITAEAGEWTYHEFSFDDFSLSNPLPGYTDLWLRFDDSGTSEPYFIDKIRLIPK